MDVSLLRPNRRSAMMRVDQSQTLVPSCLRESHIAITRLRVPHAAHGETEAFELEEAYILSVHLSAAAYSFAYRGETLARLEVSEKTVAALDLKKPWHAVMHTPFDVMHFHIPQVAMNRVAEQLEAPKIESLDCHPARMHNDPVLYGLAVALLPGVERPYEESRLFVDYTRFVLGAHVARLYGGLKAVSPTRRGGLSAWQERRATEMISENLAGNVTVDELAKACEISVGHFVRAFRKTTGLTPHRWLTERRIDKAKAALKMTRLPISEIAVNCGFSDQSHFTRVFSQVVGISPAAWRRAYGDVAC